MILSPPIIITSRLLPGVKVGSATISISYSPRPGDDTALGQRTRYRYYIDLPDYEYAADDLQSGCGGGTLQSGLESLLAFLSACGESYNYRGEEGENSDLFPLPLAQWCADHTDQLTLLQLELEETKDLIQE